MIFNLQTERGEVPLPKSRGISFMTSRTYLGLIGLGLASLIAGHLGAEGLNPMSFYVSDYERVGRFWWLIALSTILLGLTYCFLGAEFARRFRNCKAALVSVRGAARVRGAAGGERVVPSRAHPRGGSRGPAECSRLPDTILVRLPRAWAGLCRGGAPCAEANAEHRAGYRHHVAATDAGHGGRQGRHGDVRRVGAFFHCAGNGMACVDGFRSGAQIRTMSGGALTVRNFLRQCRGEIIKTLAAPPLILGFYAVVAAEALILFLLGNPMVQESLRLSLRKVGLSLEENFSGLTVAASILGYTSVSVGTLFGVLAGCHIYGQEREEGTMRAILARTVSRPSILLQKWLALSLYVHLLTLFTGGLALALGLISYGKGNLLTWNFEDHIFGWAPFEPGLRRYAVALAFLSLTQTLPPTLACAISYLRVKPVTAGVAALSLLAGDQIICVNRLAPDAVMPFMLHTYLFDWMHAFQDGFTLWHLAKTVCIVLLVELLVLLGALAVWSRQDAPSSRH